MFDLTDPDLKLKGLGGFVLSGLMEAQKEKAYLVTTGYNRNMIRFMQKDQFFYKEDNNTIDIRVVCKDSHTVRIHDDCRKFDPREHMRLFDKNSPEKAIGLRMVAKLALQY